MITFLFPAILLAQLPRIDTAARISPVARVDTAALRKRRELTSKAVEPTTESLMRMRTPRIARALQSPESLLAFVTRPAPFYLERRAAALQSKGLIPVAWVPRLWALMGELRRSESVDSWRIRSHPYSAVMYNFEPRGPPKPLESRIIVGARWTPSKEPVDYPLTPEERENAPWPWQVQIALRDVYAGLVPSTYAPLERAKAEAYLAAVMTMPCRNDDEAQLFAQATQYSSHFKTPALMGALRNIALNPLDSVAALQVSSGFADATRLWDDPDSWAIGSAGMVDIIRDSPHVIARINAAYWVRTLREVFRDGRTVRRAIPAAVVIEVSRRALDPSAESEWNRLYGYAFSVMEALDDPPFKAERGMDPQSPLVAQRLEAFRTWFDANRSMLEELARAQAPAIEAARRAMVTEKCR